MNHERFEELKDAYALNALPKDEQNEMEAYLDDHPGLWPEVEELCSVSNLLAFAPAEQEPPQTLRRNVMRVVEAEAGQHESGSQSSIQRLRAYLSFQRFALGAAAVALVALLSWNVLLQTQDDSLSSYELQSSGAAAGVKAEVVEVRQDQYVLTAENMPNVPEDKTMQIWVIEDGKPKPGGTFRPKDGLAASPVTTPIQGAGAVAVTIEPAGGSDQPTTEPVMQTEL